MMKLMLGYIKRNAHEVKHAVSAKWRSFLLKLSVIFIAIHLSQRKKNIKNKACTKKKKKRRGEENREEIKRREIGKGLKKEQLEEDKRVILAPGVSAQIMTR